MDFLKGECLNEGGEKGMLSDICIAFPFHGALLVIEPSDVVWLVHYHPCERHSTLMMLMAINESSLLKLCVRERMRRYTEPCCSR
jgi:hypothetical protein